MPPSCSFCIYVIVIFTAGPSPNHSLSSGTIVGITLGALIVLVLGIVTAFATLIHQQKCKCDYCSIVWYSTPVPSNINVTVEPLYNGHFGTSLFWV